MCQFGHVVLLGGERGSGGAIMLAAEAALRTGAGLVSVGTRPEHVQPLLTRRPEIMVRALESQTEAAELIERASVVCVGPGLGTGAWAEQLLAAAQSIVIQKVYTKSFKLTLFYFATVKALSAI